MKHWREKILFSINSENEQQQKQLVATFVLPNRRSPTLPLLTILTTTLKLHKTTKENNRGMKHDDFWQLSSYWTFCWRWKDNEGIIERGSALKLRSKWIEQNDKLASGSGWCKIEAAIVWVKFEQTCLNLVQSTFMWNSDCRWYNIDCELWQTTSLGKLV